LRFHFICTSSLSLNQASQSVRFYFIHSMRIILFICSLYVTFLYSFKFIISGFQCFHSLPILTKKCNLRTKIERCHKTSMFVPPASQLSRTPSRKTDKLLTLNTWNIKTWYKSWNSYETLLLWSS
jgi:hypothetical protein